MLVVGFAVIATHTLPELSTEILRPNDQPIVPIERSLSLAGSTAYLTVYERPSAVRMTIARGPYGVHFVPTE